MRRQFTEATPCPTTGSKRTTVSPEPKKLGAAVLSDDDEAVAFAKLVIRELINRDAKLYATWTMEVTAGRRSVASVPFESAAIEDGANDRDIDR